jgi:hypothetical protein
MYKYIISFKNLNSSIFIKLSIINPYLPIFRGISISKCGAYNQKDTLMDDILNIVFVHAFHLVK